MQKGNFTIHDYLILFSILIVSIVIGLSHKLSFACKKKRVKQNECEIDAFEMKENVENVEQSKIDEYLVGGRNMSTLPVALSILASIFSTNTLIGLPAEVYQYGVQIIVMVIPMVIAPVLSAFVFLPIISRLKIVTLYEYFQLRYNSRLVRLIGAVIYLLTSTLWTSTILYGTSMSLSTVTNINVYLLMSVIAMVTVVYTALGGLRGVIMTDVFQLAIMCTGLIFIIVKGSSDAGGIAKVWNLSDKGGRLNFFDFSLNPFIRQSFWSIMIGSLIRWLMQYNTDQSIIQRFSATKNIRKAQAAVLINTAGSVFIIFSSCLIGLIIYATYANCDPMNIPKSGIRNPNQLFSYYVNDKLNTVSGASGFIQGALISAALSTASSTLNSQSAILWKDCLRPFSYFSKFNDDHSLRLAKTLVFVMGTISLFFAFFLTLTQGNLVQIGVLVVNSITTPLALLFFLGICFYFVNATGAIVGSLFTLACGMWIFTGQSFVSPIYPKLPSSIACLNSTHNFTGSGFYSDTTSTEAINVTGFNKIYSISFHLISVFTLTIGVIIGLVVSLATGGLHNTVPSNLVLCNKKSK